MGRYIVVSLVLVCLIGSYVRSAPSHNGSDTDPSMVSPYEMDAGDGGGHGNAPVTGEDHSKNGTNGSHGSEDNVRYYVVEVNFEKLSSIYGIVLWILFASIAKIGFHAYNKLSSVFPESCLLIMLGVIVGVILFFGLGGNSYTLDANTFFYYLLPPIILESSYFMPNRAFFGNIGTILLFAVVGTLFNTFSIGLSLYGVSQAGLLSVPGYEKVIPMLHCLVFSSLVSAVDPVAVLAVFEEIHVNEVLHICVFGESLLNDAVTVVLYHMFEKYVEIGDNINVYDGLAGALSFVLTGIVGTLIGVFYGFLGAFITKYTSHVRVIEPIFVFVLAYLAYLTAEIFHFSGIMALTFCAIVMKRYVESNISEKSKTTVKYFMKMLASISETVMFMLLGTSTVVDTHELNWKLILFTLFFCLAYRSIGVVVLSYLANKKRLAKLTLEDQFVMAYGGLRGAIAFCLAILINDHHIEAKGLFVTTTIIVVFFTVFIQGISIKPLVNVLRVKKAEKFQSTMNEQIHERLIDHLMAGIEDLTGSHGNNWIRDKFEQFDNLYLKKLLLRKQVRHKERGIMRVHTKLALKEAMEGLSKSSSHNSSTEKSLLRLIRNYSTTSMHSSDKNNNGVFARSLQRRLATNGGAENGDPLETTGEDTVIDLQALNVHYSKKLADDTKIHHILNDSMLQTRRRWTKPQKHDIPDTDYTPYHHSERTHARKIISHHQRKAIKKQLLKEQLRKKAAEASERDGGGLAPPYHMAKNVSFADVLEAGSSTSSSNVNGGPHVNFTLDDSLRTCPLKEEEEECADGITFAVNRFYVQAEDEDDVDSRWPSAEPTAAETQLPWKRQESAGDKPQTCEHPTWVDNVEYSPEMYSDSLIPDSPKHPTAAQTMQSADGGYVGPMDAAGPPPAPSSGSGSRRVSWSMSPPTIVESAEEREDEEEEEASEDVPPPPQIGYPPMVDNRASTIEGKTSEKQTLLDSIEGASGSSAEDLAAEEEAAASGLSDRYRSSLERIQALGEEHGSDDMIGQSRC